jgi:hypothetical protein
LPGERPPEGTILTIGSPHVEAECVVESSDTMPPDRSGIKRFSAGLLDKQGNSPLRH